MNNSKSNYHTSFEFLKIYQYRIVIIFEGKKMITLVCDIYVIILSGICHIDDRGRLG